MVAYAGSKRNYARFIVPIINSYLTDPYFQWYYEPFVGGMNILPKVKCANKMANDINEYVIEMYKAVLSGWEPPDHLSKELYLELKEKYKQGSVDSKPLIGFAGSAASFRKKWYDKYCINQSKIVPDCIPSRKASLLKLKEAMKHVHFKSGCYSELDIFPNSVVYCDPPYQGTSDPYIKQQGKNFDYDKFVEWMYKVSKDSVILLSEYNSPTEDFKLLWEFDGKQPKGKKDREKLFLLDRRS